MLVILPLLMTMHTNIEINSKEGSKNKRLCIISFLSIRNFFNPYNTQLLVVRIKDLFSSDKNAIFYFEKQYLCHLDFLCSKHCIIVQFIDKPNIGTCINFAEPKRHCISCDFLFCNL